MKIYRLLKVLMDNSYNAIIKKHYRIIVGNNTIIRGRIHVRGNKNSVRIGSNTVINSDTISVPLGYQSQVYFWCFDKGNISIGDGCGISNASFCSACSIVLEDNVLIGGGVKVFDTDFHSLNYENRIDIDGDCDRKCSPVLIKQGAFIGAGSLILKGVTVGERSIVGAGSVVVKSIPDDEVWGGNPAKFIRKNSNTICGEARYDKG